MMVTWEPATALPALFTAVTLFVAALWTWANIFKACGPPPPDPPAQRQDCCHQPTSTGQQMPTTSNRHSDSNLVAQRCRQACEGSCRQASRDDVTCQKSAHWRSPCASPGEDNNSTLITPAGAQGGVTGACSQACATGVMQAPEQGGLPSNSNDGPQTTGATPFQHDQMPFTDHVPVGRSSSSQSLSTAWDDTTYTPLHSVSLGLYNTTPVTGYHLPTSPFGTATFPPSARSSELRQGRRTSLYGNFRNARLAVLSSRLGVNPTFMASLCEQPYRAVSSGPISASSPLRGVFEDLHTTAAAYASCPASPTTHHHEAAVPVFMPAIPEVHTTASSSSNIAQ